MPEISARTRLVYWYFCQNALMIRSPLFDRLSASSNSGDDRWLRQTV